MSSGRGGRILILAQGRAGDRLAAPLASAVLRHFPGIECIGAGGEALEAAGVRLIARTGELSAMGYSGLLPLLPRALREAGQLARALRGCPPVCSIAIDMWQPLQYLKRMSPELAASPVICYMPPGPNFTGLSRLHAACAGAFESILTPFPHQAGLFERAGARVRPAAHAGLLAALREAAPVESAARDRLAILPGSRAAEVRTEFPRQQAAAAALLKAHPAWEPVVCCASAAVRRFVERRAGGMATSLETRAELARAAFALICSGTASLEAAVLGCPGVVSYHGTIAQRAEWRIFHVRRLAELRRAGIISPFIALPNIVAGREIYPEVIDASPGDLRRVALETASGDLDRRRGLLQELTASLYWDDPGEVIVEEVSRILNRTAAQRSSGGPPSESRPPKGSR